MNLETVERILATGRIVQGSSKVVGEGASGVISRVLLQDADGSGRALGAVLKPANSPQEVFAWKVARALGIDHLVPAAARRADGSAAIRYVQGARFDDALILDGSDLRSALEQRYLLRGAGVEAAQHQARIDHELLEVFDWFTANRDRKAANTLHQAAEGASYFIDQGAALRGELADPLRPRLKDTFYLADAATPNRITLSEEVRTIVRRRLTDDVIRDAHAELQLQPAHVRGAHDHAFLDRARSDHQLDRLFARRDSLLQRGYIEYDPVTPETRRLDSAQLRRELFSGTFDTWRGSRQLLPPERRP